MTGRARVNRAAECPKCGRGPVEWWKTLIGTPWWRCLACGEFGRND